MADKKFTGVKGFTVADTQYRYETVDPTPKGAPNVVYIVMDDMVSRIWAAMAPIFTHRIWTEWRGKGCGITTFTRPRSAPRPELRC